MESPKTAEQNDIEKMKADISGRLEKAKNNPIEENRLAELEGELNLYKSEFIKKGHREVQNIIKEDEIEAEILRSSALADNLSEYREMLDQISTTYGLGKEWADDMLAHENSHANVAEQTGHEWVGYAAIFIKDAEGNITNIQPLHFTKPDLAWGPKESIVKNLEVTLAPEVYGNKLSEGDELSIAEDQKHMEQIKLQEDQDKIRLEELRLQLGI